MPNDNSREEWAHRAAFNLRHAESVRGLREPGDPRTLELVRRMGWSAERVERHMRALADSEGRHLGNAFAAALQAAGEGY